MSDNTSINKDHFNKIASEYDTRYEDTLTEIESELRANRDLIGMRQGGRFLDYACGTGLLSRSFHGQASQCVGIDLSESMVEVYNAKAKTEGLYPDARQAYLGNLLSDEQDDSLTSPEFFDFDAAGAGFCFHHFDHPEQAAQRLVARLRPGGVLFILDFVADKDGHSHGHSHDHGHGHSGEQEFKHSHASHGVAHNGFSEDQVKSMFEAAGAGGDFQFKEFTQPLVMKDGHGKDMDLVKRVFIARGSKL